MNLASKTLYQICPQCSCFSIRDAIKSSIHPCLVFCVIPVLKWKDAKTAKSLHLPFNERAPLTFFSSLIKNVKKDREEQKRDLIFLIICVIVCALSPCYKR